MKLKFIAICFTLFVTISYADAGNKQLTLPKDVVKFKHKRDICEHIRGEEPYDEARKKYLNKAWKASCPGSDQALILLKRKYKNNAEVLKALENYEESIE